MSKLSREREQWLKIATESKYTQEVIESAEGLDRPWAFWEWYLENTEYWKNLKENKEIENKSKEDKDSNRPCMWVPM